MEIGTETKKLIRRVSEVFGGLEVWDAKRGVWRLVRVKSNTGENDAKR
jgi:hypothetical protein